MPFRTIPRARHARKASILAMTIAALAIAPVVSADVPPGPPPKPCTLETRSEGRECVECTGRYGEENECDREQKELGRTQVCSRDDEAAEHTSARVYIWCGEKKSSGCNVSGASAGALSLVGLVLVGLMRRRQVSARPR